MGEGKRGGPPLYIGLAGALPDTHSYLDLCTVEPQWLEHHWDHGNMFRDMGSSSHWGLIMAHGQEANGDKLGNFFRSSIQ